MQSDALQYLADDPTDHRLAGAVGERFIDQLVARGRLAPELADRVERVRAESADRLAGVLLKLGILSEADLAAELSEFLELPIVDESELTRASIPIPALTSEFLRAHEVFPLAMDEPTLRFACWDALDESVADALQFAVGKRAVPFVARRADVLAALDRCIPIEKGDATVLEPSLQDDDEIDRLKDLASEEPVIRLVQRLIDQAVELHASDIHLEPVENALVVRFRADGMLREMERCPRELSAPVTSRIKVMAGLNIAERRLPQDGRISVTVRGKEIDFRVATSPTLHGESVVLRILDRQDVALDFSSLGFDDALMGTLRAAIARPNGIVLVTGPTGSGKTTTLYAALQEINTPEKKILTVEDPVEYQLPGVNQVPVRPQIGLSFAQALRAFLRQDPDVLMVGEIRDRETAEIAIQAALTGHLLLSTLHTNTAAAAVTRLLDMGIDDYLLTSTLHLVLGQRLVRRLCESCRQPFVPDAATRLRFALPPRESLTWYHAGSCPRCQGSGYRGRVAILEALPMTEAIRAKVLARADAHEIEKAAVSQGMRTLFAHGLERVNAGVTTLEEVLRVTNLN